MAIIRKSEREIDKMRESGRYVAKIIHKIGKHIRAGITTVELEKLAQKELQELGVKSAFKDYHGYPAHICVSVNDVVVHGIPGSYIIQDGDIVSIDVGVVKDGYYGDAAASFYVGDEKLYPERKRLVDTTREALYSAIEQCREGRRLSDISYAVQNYSETRGYSVVRDYVGHGIGTQMHEDPQIPNFGPPNKGPLLKKGMTLAIEPMLNIGAYEVMVGSDGWSVCTVDGKCSAHFEHTVVITGKDEPEIITCLETT